MKLKFLFVLLSFAALNATEENNSSLYYLKLGASYPSGTDCVLPTFGLGARFQKNQYGFDLSANLSSMVFVNYASLKGLFLFYPNVEKKNQWYVGIGPGLGYYLKVAKGHPTGSRERKHGCVALEGCLGYEFRHYKHFKTFVQLEFSQPVIHFGGRNFDRSYRPGIGFSAGFGF